MNFRLAPFAFVLLLFGFGLEVNAVAQPHERMLLRRDASHQKAVVEGELRSYVEIFDTAFQAPELGERVRIEENGRSAVFEIKRVSHYMDGVTSVSASGPDGFLTYSFGGGKMLGRITHSDDYRSELIGYDPSLHQHYLAGVSSEQELQCPVDEKTLTGMPQQSTTPIGHPTYKEWIAQKVEEDVQIDLLVAYTTSSKTMMENSGGVDLVISQMMNLTQSVFDFQNSGIVLNLVLAHPTNYTETFLEDSESLLCKVTESPSFLPTPCTSYARGRMDEIHALRDQYAADLVMLLARMEDAGGIGWIMGSTQGSPDLGFTVNRIQQVLSSYTVAHEIGHNLGSHHSRNQQNAAAPASGGVFPYSTGWRWTGDDGKEYVTVMTYADNGERLPFFSSPDWSYEGVPLGSYTGPYAPADNLRSIMETKSIVAGYRTEGAPLNPAPVLTSLAPLQGARGSTVEMTIMGQHFMDGMSIYMPTGTTFIEGAVVSSTRVDLRFSINANAQLGSRNIVLNNPPPGGGDSNALTFTIVDESNPPPPPPSLTLLSPNTGRAGSTVALTLTGQNLKQGSTVHIEGTGAQISGVVWQNATTMTASLNLSAGATLGLRNLWVKDPGTGGAESNRLEFLILPAEAPSYPTLLTMSPTSIHAGVTTPLAITGQNLKQGSTAHLAGGGVEVVSLTWHSSTSMTAEIRAAADALAGYRDLWVKDPGQGGHESNILQFQVIPIPKPPPPDLTSLTPAFGRAGTTVALTLGGQNFKQGATVHVVPPSGITVSNVTWHSATTITASLHIDATANLTEREVRVDDPGEDGAQSHLLPFQLLPPAPELLGVSPDSGIPGTTVPLVLSGKYFRSGVTVHLEGTDITVSDISMIGSTSISASLHIPGEARLGTRDLWVKNAGGEPESNRLQFHVEAPIPAPVLTSLSPASGQLGQSVQVQLQGVNFPASAQVSVSGSPVVTVSQVEVVSSQLITARFAIPGNAVAGSRSVTVSDPSPGGSSSNAVSFALVAPVPNLPPSFAVSIPNLKFLHTGGVQEIALTGISAGAGEQQTVTFSAVVEDPFLIPFVEILYTNPQTSGVLRLLNDRSRVGTTKVRIMARDDGGTSHGGVDSTVVVLPVEVALDTGTDSDGVLLPAEVALMPNYPNPFNPTTQIPFELPRRANVRITVVDALGRLVATVADGSFPAGRHQAVFDAVGLPSGIYLFRLESDGLLLTRKMTLVK